MTKVTTTDHTVQLIYSFNCVLFSPIYRWNSSFFSTWGNQAYDLHMERLFCISSLQYKTENNFQNPNNFRKINYLSECTVSHSFWGIRSVTNVCGVVKFWNLLYFFSYFTLLKKTSWEPIDKRMDQEETLHTVQFPLKNAF